MALPVIRRSPNARLCSSLYVLPEAPSARSSCVRPQSNPVQSGPIRSNQNHAEIHVQQTGSLTMLEDTAATPEPEPTLENLQPNAPVKPPSGPVKPSQTWSN